MLCHNLLRRSCTTTHTSSGSSSILRKSSSRTPTAFASLPRYQTGQAATGQQPLLLLSSLSQSTNIVAQHPQRQHQQQQQQCRSIFSYISNLFRRDKLDGGHSTSGNPIIEVLQQQQQPIKAISSSKSPDHGVAATESIVDSDSGTVVTATAKINLMTNFPKFSLMKPSHVIDAYKYVKQEQLQQLQKAVAIVTATKLEREQNGVELLLHKLDTLIHFIDTIQQPYYTLRQIASFMYTTAANNDINYAKKHTIGTSSQATKSEWYNVIQQMQNDSGSGRSQMTHTTFPTTTTTNASVDATANVATVQWQKLHNILQTTMTEILQQQQQQFIKLSQRDRSNLYAAHYLIKNYYSINGVEGLELSNDNSSRFKELSNVMEDITTSVLDIESTAVSKSNVQLIYSYIGVRTEQVKLLGYNTVADQIFALNTTGTGTSISFKEQLSKASTTTAITANATATNDITTVRQLHTDMTQRILPILRQITDQRRRRPHEPKLALESYLTNSSNTSGDDSNSKVSAVPSEYKYSIPQYKSDIRSMIYLEHHVTLTGALQFSFRLLQDIFGISIVECTDNAITSTTLWDDSVRLFHCYDTLNHDTYIGSIYIDPYQRGEKMPRPVTVPILARSHSQDPIVCIRLTLEVPTWDTNPAMMKWNDCEALLHELGHALQFVTATSKYGCVLGPQSMPFELTELLPKFMELWMTHHPSILALIDMSNSTTTLLSGEEIEAAYRVKAREKIMKLAELTFYGTLEMELFSTFDVKGSETILALQERLSNAILPHVEYDKSNMTALIDIVDDNVRGRQVAYYRYLLCEVHAATIFEQMLHRMSTTGQPGSMSQFRSYMRQYLLEPGANIDYATFRSKLEMDDVSINPLWKLHQLSEMESTSGV